MEYTIHDVTQENLQQVLQLHVGQKQLGFVETAKECLKDAKKDKRYYPVGLYVNNTLVGFAMYGHFQNEGAQGRVWLDRYFIDERYQGKGYGKRFLSYLLERLFQEFQCTQIFLSVHDDNQPAIHLYQNFGFCFNGELDINDEKIMVLTAKDIYR